MSRPLPSATLEAAVRQHFGLSQAELARYLGVSAGLVAHLEAGRRRPTAATSQRLDELARLLPPPEGNGPAAPDFEKLQVPDAPVLPLPDLGPLPAAPLRKRHKQVLAQAARLRLVLHQGGKGVALQQRRQWGLGVLQAGLLAPDPAGPDPVAQAHRLRWLATLAADVAGAAPAAPATAARALAVVRLLALEAEAATLAGLLADG